jgi:hypothetical protein
MAAEGTGAAVAAAATVAIGVAMKKSTTSYFWFLLTFRHNRICGLAVAFKNYASKNNPQNEAGVSRELRPNANNVIRPPPPNPPLHAMICHVFRLGLYSATSIAGNFF